MARVTFLSWWISLHGFDLVLSVLQDISALDDVTVNYFWHCVNSGNYSAAFFQYFFPWSQFIFWDTMPAFSERLEEIGLQISKVSLSLFPQSTCENLYGILEWFKKTFWLREDWFVFSLKFKVLIFLDGETHIICIIMKKQKKICILLFC